MVSLIPQAYPGFETLALTHDPLKPLNDIFLRLSVFELDPIATSSLEKVFWTYGLSASALVLTSPKQSLHTSQSDMSNLVFAYVLSFSLSILYYNSMIYQYP